MRRRLSVIDMLIVLMVLVILPAPFLSSEIRVAHRALTERLLAPAREIKRLRDDSIRQAEDLAFVRWLLAKHDSAARARAEAYWRRLNQ